MDRRYKGSEQGPALVTADSLLVNLGGRRSRPETIAVIYFHPHIGKMLKQKKMDSKVLVVGAQGVGSPALALQIEMLAAQGIRRFITLGTAGALDTKLEIGELLFSKQSLIDEGTSPHYGVPAGSFVSPTLNLKATVGSAAKGVDVWTTDAPLRETNEKVRYYSSQGIQAVDMESSALYSVAGSLNLEALALFAVSDRFLLNVESQITWQPHFQSKLLEVSLSKMVAVLDNGLLDD